MSWPLANFDEVAVDISGGNVKTLQSDFLPSGLYPVIDQGQSFIAGYSDDASRLCRTTGPVIVFGDHTKAFKFVDFPFCMGADGTKVIAPKAGVDAKYLYYALRTVHIPAAGYSRHFKYLKAGKLPLPPLPEQRRIAAILDQADALRRLRRQSLSRLSDLGQAIFFEMFGSADPTPCGSISCSLEDIIHPDDKLNYGVVQPGHEIEDGVPLVRAGDLLQPNLNISGLKRISPSIEKNYKRSRLTGSEILIGCVGSIGAIALATPDLKGANIARAVARVPLDLKLCDRVFIAEQLKTPHIQRYFSRETRTVSQPTLNIKQIKEAPIFLPPLEVQRSFSARLHALAPLTDGIDASLTQLDILFASLQHRAFRGEL